MSNERNQSAASPLYKFHDFYRKKNGSFMIVGKEEGNPKGIFKIPATVLVNKRKDLLSMFGLEDKINIIGLATIESAPTVTVNQTKQFKYFPLLAMIFGCSLIISNIASSKLILFWGNTFTGGTLPYLITYIMGDIITEVYGYKRARQLIWGAMVSNLSAILFISLAINATPAPFWTNQKEYALILGAVPRVIIASLISYFCGEFLNAYVIAKRKISHNGKYLWRRIILASLIAMTVDNFLFLSFTYWGVMPLREMVEFSSRSYFLGLIFEWSAIPLISLLCNKLKHIENTNIFDIDTKFNPFSLDVDYNSTSALRQN